MPPDTGAKGHSYDKFGIVNPMVPLAKTLVGLYGIKVPAEHKVTYSASVPGTGTSVNAISPQVFVEVDMRSTSTSEVERVDRELRAIAGQAVDEENAARSTARGSVSVDFQVIGKRPADQTDETKGIAAITFGAATAFGYDSHFIAVSTDANVPMSLGIPAITIGSGLSGGLATIISAATAR